MNDTPGSPSVQREVISLTDVVKKTGKAQEYHHDRARFGLARWMLWALLGLTLISLLALMFCPPDRLADAKEFFAFVKATVPPLVTLVAGFYFGQSSRGP
jgi:hypothetical protein